MKTRSKIVGSIINLLYKSLFSWWLEPWSQRRKQQRLSEAIKQSLRPPFPMRILGNRRPQIQPFDYATIHVETGYMILGITQGRGEVALTIGPRTEPCERYKLLQVVASLEGTTEWQVKSPRDLRETDILLQSRWEQLNQLFAPAEAAAREALQLQTIKNPAPVPQLEWERKKRSWAQQ